MLGKPFQENGGKPLIIIGCCIGSQEVLVAACILYWLGNMAPTDHARVNNWRFETSKFDWASLSLDLSLSWVLVLLSFDTHTHTLVLYTNSNSGGVENMTSECNINNTLISLKRLLDCVRLAGQRGVKMSDLCPYQYNNCEAVKAAPVYHFILRKHK